eukprot:4815916-Prymnesium_polylepis.1
MAMLDLGMTGTKFTVEMVPGLTDLSGLKQLDLLLFYAFYLGGVILLVIVLLRLLMAMMTTTFQGVMRRATTEWRLQFAQAVLLIELIWPKRFADTNAGEVDANG